MNPDRWPEVERLYEQVVALPVDQRAAFLDKASAEDDELRREVTSLISLETVATDFLEQPALRSAATSLSLALPHLKLPDVPGYDIIRELGEGGMGVVYLAEQLVPLKRVVALKLIRPGMDSRQVLARFERERQALARMDHPNIAAVFDAGSTTDGRPYFVMEYVDGVSITEYCDSRQLSIRSRLSLFIQVCNAVQHAHQKGVIHRDLKPSNVLVIDRDGRPVPKVIDFGTAKSTEPASDATTLTTDGLVFGTVEYMSPEQAAFSSDIDTTTDVYSLGVLLYELLVGCTPFNRQAVETKAVEAVLKAIRDSDPPRPSSLVTREEFVASVNARGTDVGVLTKQLAGDLDWIVLKALEKDRHRRYQTAASLGADVQRFQDSKPIEARPPSVPYRIRKFTRRYRGAVAAASAMVLILVLGLVTSTALYQRAERSSQQATTAADSLRVAMNDLTYRNYLLTIGAADSDVRSGKFASARARLLTVRERSGNWEWSYLFNQTDESVFRTASSTPQCMDRRPDSLFSASQVLAVEAASGNVVLRRCRAVETWTASGAKDATILTPPNKDRTNREQKVLAVDARSKSMVAVEWRLRAPEWSVSLVDGRTKPVELGRFNDQPECADIAPDGRHVAIGFNISRFPQRDLSYAFEVRAIGSDHAVRFVPTPIDRDSPRVPMPCHVRFSPDGTLVASSAVAVDVWDPKSGSPYLRIAGRARDYGQPLAFSRTGKRLAIGRSDGSIDLVRMTDGEADLTLKQDLPEAVVALAFSDDESTLASGAGKSVTIWDLAERTSRVQTGHEANVVGVALSRDGRTVYSADAAGQLRGWPVKLRPAVNQITGTFRPAPMVVNQSGSIVAGRDKDGLLGVLRLPDLERTKFASPSGVASRLLFGVRTVAVSQDGSLLYIAEGDGTIRMLTLPDGRPVPGTKALPFDDSDCQFSYLASAGPESTALSWDGRLLAVGADHCIAVLDARTLRRVAEMKSEGNHISSLLFRDDGRLMVAMMGRDGRGRSQIQIWDWKTNRTLATRYPGAESSSPGAQWKLTQSADGQKIGLLSYTPGFDKAATLAIWDRDLGKELARLAVGDSADVALSPDGRRAVTVSPDNPAARIWDIAGGSQVLTLPDTGGHPAGVKFTKFGQIIAVRSDGGITIWDPRPPASR